MKFACRMGVKNKDIEGVCKGAMALSGLGSSEGGSVGWSYVAVWSQKTAGACEGRGTTEWGSEGKCCAGPRGSTHPHLGHSFRSRTAGVSSHRNGESECCNAHCWPKLNFCRVKLDPYGSLEWV